MTRGSKKGKKSNTDFLRVKHKVGRKLPPSKNETSTEIKSKVISLPEQSLAMEKEGLAVNKKQQTLKELLMQTTHHNVNVRRDALHGIRDLLRRHPEELQLHKLAIIEKLCPRMSDVDRNVREALFTLLKSQIFENLDEAVMGPLISVVMAHIFSSLTQFAVDIRIMAFKFLNLVVKQYRSIVTFNYADKILQHYANVLRRSSGFLHDKNKLLDILNNFVEYLSALYASLHEGSSTTNQESENYGALHKYKSNLPKQISAGNTIHTVEDKHHIGKHLQDLVPILLETWVECAPLVSSAPSPDSYSLESMLSILDGLKLTCKCISCIEEKNSNKTHSFFHLSKNPASLELHGNLSNVVTFLRQHILTIFPLCPSSQCSHKVQERFILLNIRTCEVALEILHCVDINSNSFQRLLDYIESAFKGQMLPGYPKRFSENFMISVIPFMPTLLSYVPIEWKERLLKVFTEAFERHCTKLTLQTSFLLSIEDILFNNAGENVIQDSQIKWVHLLPKILWELKHENPASSKVVLQVLHNIGRCAAENSLLYLEYTKLQPMLMPFFSMQIQKTNEVKIIYGPFVRLPKDCQEIAVDCLYYFSEFSVACLESLIHCSLYSGLELSVVIRIIHVIHASYCKGHIKIADHISFLLSLIVGCKDVPDNPEESSVDREISRTTLQMLAKYKAVTCLVASCLSEMGDERVILQLVKPSILKVLNFPDQKPSRNVTCSLLRVIVALCSKFKQIASDSIPELAHHIFSYLKDIAHDHVKDDGGKEHLLLKYQILPCIYIFSRSNILTISLFKLLESSTLEEFESPIENSMHLCALIWVATQIYKNDRIHPILLSCESSTKSILKRVTEFQASHALNLTSKERNRLQNLHSGLKVTASAAHNWK